MLCHFCVFFCVRIWIWICNSVCSPSECVVGAGTWSCPSKWGPSCRTCPCHEGLCLFRSQGVTPIQRLLMWRNTVARHPCLNQDTIPAPELLLQGWGSTTRAPQWNLALCPAQLPSLRYSLSLCCWEHSLMGNPIWDLQESIAILETIWGKTLNPLLENLASWLVTAHEARMNWNLF